MGYIGYFTVVSSKDIIKSPYNPRLDSMADRVERGKILDRNGNVLAKTDLTEDGSEYRYYPYGDIFAHVVGYSVQGKSGLESTANFELLTSNAFILEKLKKEFQDQKNIGDHVVTTLDVDLQTAAYHALGDNKGAVVVMEPSTGKILTMVSKPSFDPNSVIENWDWLNSDADSILLNRATQGLCRTPRSWRGGFIQLLCEFMQRVFLQYRHGIKYCRISEYRKGSADWFKTSGRFCQSEKQLCLREE